MRIKRTMNLFKNRNFEVFGADILKSNLNEENNNFEVKYSNFENEKLNMMIIISI